MITTNEAIVRNLLYLSCRANRVARGVRDRTWANAVFANRPMRWLGERSYSVFLLHLVVLEGAMNVLGYRMFTGSATAVWVLTMAGTIVLAPSRSASSSGRRCRCGAGSGRPRNAPRRARSVACTP